MATKEGCSKNICQILPMNRDWRFMCASKYNKIEHRLFSQISLNMQGQPLLSIDIFKSLIESTFTVTGLYIICVIDDNIYDKGQSISDTLYNNISITHSSFLGDWNYIIFPCA